MRQRQIRGLYLRAFSLVLASPVFTLALPFSLCSLFFVLDFDVFGFCPINSHQTPDVIFESLYLRSIWLAHVSLGTGHNPDDCI